MRPVLLCAMSLAALLGATAIHSAKASPVVAVTPSSLHGPAGELTEPVYYYKGRYYPYRNGGHYYHHRSYRHGRWSYY